MPRQVFAENEKVILLSLLSKYKLNRASTIKYKSPGFKKEAWAQLTTDFNSIETNSKRTEAQLKKCWDNLKTRKKIAIAAEKRERMQQTGGALFPQRPIKKEYDEETTKEENNPGHDGGSGRGDHGAEPTNFADSKNMSQTENEEFILPQSLKKIQLKYEEEMRQLKKTEMEWLVKAAEEKYKKAKLEREVVELQLSNIRRNSIFQAE